MSEDNVVPQSAIDQEERHSDFRMAFNDFLLDHMLFKDGSTPVLELSRTMLLKCPQPASMLDFLRTTKPLILEDIGKLSQ